MTISDYYRERYGRVVEVFCRSPSSFSYLGWVSAQSHGPGAWYSTSVHGGTLYPRGMVIGAAIHPWAYTLLVACRSVATDRFIQMIMRVAGVSLFAFAGNQAGGADQVIALPWTKTCSGFRRSRPSKTSWALRRLSP